MDYDLMFESSTWAARQICLGFGGEHLSLLDSRPASNLKSAFDESQAPVKKLGTMIILPVSREMDLPLRFLHSIPAFSDIKRKDGRSQQEEQLQEHGRRWLLTHGIELAMEGLAAGHEHGVAGTPLSAVVAYNPETAESNYLDADKSS
ncbi:hypothetical protein Tco_1067040 [Tanacetum coccineum]|uniref:Uncharacterized protein n=1 Tax=Tanacetum coccineum TaxID=301880 RepID=A0ABQ5HBQ2_9ASTR